MKSAELYQKGKDESLKCAACAHYCKISSGNAGICGVRKNNNGVLELLVYGKCIAAHIDPMEKKPLFHFLPGKEVFSIGTIGCNFGCGFCQNWDISQASKITQTQSKSLEDHYVALGKITQLGQDLSPKKIVDYCLENEIPAIAYTYNEPTIFIEYAKDTMKLAKPHGIKNIFVSNGFESPEALEYLDGYLDAINVDLKSFREEYYRQICRAHLQPVLDTIEQIHQMGVWLEITTLVVTGENDSEKELKQIADFIASVDQAIPWHISRFHPDFKMTEKQATSLETLESAYQIGKEAGLKYIYVGNVITDNKENTYCPECSRLLIARSGYATDLVGIEKGVCQKCKTEIEGVWK